MMMRVRWIEGGEGGGYDFMIMSYGTMGIGMGL